MTERDLQRRIVEFVRGRPGWWIVKYHQDGRYATAGTPDLLAVHKGQFVAVEVKMPGRKPSKLQEAVLRRISQAGGVTAVIDSLDKARQLVLDIEEGTWDGRFGRPGN